MAKPKGGAREGAGRKPIAIEEKVQQLCQNAIIAKWGSLEEGIKALLESKSDRLKMFAFEHALGKPTEKVDLSGGLTIQYTRRVVK